MLEEKGKQEELMANEIDQNVVADGIPFAKLSFFLKLYAALGGAFLVLFLLWF